MKSRLKIPVLLSNLNSDSKGYLSSPVLHLTGEGEGEIRGERKGADKGEQRRSKGKEETGK